MDLQFLAETELFQGASQGEIGQMLIRLGAQTQRYGKDEVVLSMGEPTQRLGLVLNGGVTIENNDAWGNRSILGHIGVGQVFAETYACLPGQPLMVNVVAAGDTEILFLNAHLLLDPGLFPQQGLLVQNLLTITARKNLALSRRIFYTSSKTIRGRLLSYLSDQAVLQGSSQFSIPFDRQQLADYLGVDRSALSNELGKLRREGLVYAQKNQFCLLKQEEFL